MTTFAFLDVSYFLYDTKRRPVKTNNLSKPFLDMRCYHNLIIMYLKQEGTTNRLIHVPDERVRVLSIELSSHDLAEAQRSLDGIDGERVGHVDEFRVLNNVTLNF